MDHLRDFADHALRTARADPRSVSRERRPVVMIKNVIKDSTLRFVLAAGLIVAAAILLQARARSEVFPPRLPLQQFPQQLSGWSGTDVPIDKDVLNILGPGDFLLRVYQNQSYQNQQKTPY